MQSHNLITLDEFEDGTTVEVDIRTARSSFTAHGSISALTELCEALAWVSCALRPTPLDGPFSVSPRVHCYRERKTGKRSCTLHVNIGYTMKPLIHKGTTDSKTETGNCWHAMFQSPLVVQDFPILARDSDEPGLELQFDMITALAGVDVATDYCQALILKGFSTMLVPTESSEQSVVWHFLSNGGKRIPYFAFHEKCHGVAAIATFDSQEVQLGGFRNFVGWVSSATRHLGGSFPPKPQRGGSRN